MKKALYCLDRKEENMLVFESLEDVGTLTLGKEVAGDFLLEGDVVKIGFDDEWNVVFLEKDTEETDRRKEKMRKKLEGLFDKKQ